MITYVKPRDLSIVENDNEFVLNKGILHRTQITIDKIGSTNSFLTAFTEFCKNNKITLDDKAEINEDFHKLAEFGLINTQISDTNHSLIILNENATSFIQQGIGNITDYAIPEDIISESNVKTLNINNSPISINSILTNVKNKLENKHIYLVLPYSQRSYITAFNLLSKKLGIEYTLAFFDNENLFFTHIKHGSTGCFECLELQFISNFSGTISDYTKNISNTTESNFSVKMYGFILSILQNEIESVNLFKESTLNGNVLHFYLPTYEYDFDLNKRQTGCKICSTINNMDFNEQNIKSVNILKELLHDPVSK